MKRDVADSATPAWLQAVLAGQRAAIARLLSQLERGERAPRTLSAELAPHLGRAHVLGITGAPGAGKSTLVHALLGELLARGQRIAVVAVDPSSPITGGAVLGDRVRMGEHGAHPDVFIRSVASRGHLGGLADTTAAMIDVLDAAGFDSVIVETVGAGQSEVEIMRVADTRIVACPPGLGDNVQALKAGILEIADVLVVTKADLPGSEPAARDLKDMLHLRAAGPAGGWRVPVVKASATSGAGIAELVDCVRAHAAAAGRGRRLQGQQEGAARPRHEAPADRVRRLAAIDPLAQWLGIRCIEAGAGTATVELTLGPAHLNFNGTCHGGVTFALADTAFGLASNSHGRVAAGIDAHITYQLAAVAGETLVARASEVSRSKKLAVYRVDVTKPDGSPVSSFTGTVYVTQLPTP
ncbi:methylmalonyl Co-A mutase-associated GTPase MeaB [Ramlibacter sp.]|uniref:methylmalonyl Co-A mutase-associated GTPase MeaB n=1 Tax=Ramlibacter sp. TaxID=1917967 RepID=UPI002BA23324|nr:methylmalonyl Co-A mutase-associated GTPase MeaB [Ramlibacter sp.]HWI84138.1 methylmalonyl Co-A mutase-associated GTPase MeaB [Ramlibacter sp.]